MKPGKRPDARVVERAAVGDGAADRVAVAAEELGEAVHDDVGAPLDRADQVRRRHRVVEDQRDADLVGDAGDALDVEHVVLRVGDRLAEEGHRVVLDGGPPLLEVVGVVDERDLDAELGERVVEQVVRAAVQRRRRHDVRPGAAEVEDGERGRGLAGPDDERAGQPDRRRAAALERVEAGLEHRLRRVHDPGVDVADLGEGEQVGRALRVAEVVARRLVDRHRPRPGRRVGFGAGMDLAGLETPLLAHRGDATPPKPDRQGRICAAAAVTASAPVRQRARDAPAGDTAREQGDPRQGHEHGDGDRGDDHVRDGVLQDRAWPARDEMSPDRKAPPSSTLGSPMGFDVRPSSTRARRCGPDVASGGPRLPTPRGLATYPCRPVGSGDVDER